MNELKELRRHVLIIAKITLAMAIGIISLGLSISIAIKATDWIICSLWNFVIPSIFGLPELQNFQGFALAMLFAIARGKINFNFLKKCLSVLIPELEKAVDLADSILNLDNKENVSENLKGVE